MSWDKKGKPDSVRDGDATYLRLHHDSVPHRGILQVLSDRVIPRMQEKVLRAEHGNWGLLGDELCSLQGGRGNLVASAMHDARDEPHLVRICRGEVARSESELAHEALVSGNLRQTRERADVRREADVDFLMSRVWACRRSAASAQPGVER